MVFFGLNFTKWGASNGPFLHAFIKSKGFKAFDSPKFELLDVRFDVLLIMQSKGIA